jgi:regulator of sigma E protease
METLKTAFYFLAVLSALVIVHEWGHFIVAKLCKMRVEDFSLFFGKVIYRLGERNGTVYNIRAIPLGGFVKISGMEPDDISNGAPIVKRRDGSGRLERVKTLRGLSEDTLSGITYENVSDRVRQAVADAVSDSQLTENGKQELNALLHSTAINSDEHRYIEAILGAALQQPDPDGYNQKPIWQRAAVIFAGPFMSLMFGYVLFCVMGFTTGLPYDTKSDPIILGVTKDKPAARAGLKAGDRVLQIDGKEITDGKEMIKAIQEGANQPLKIEVQRGSEKLALTVTPEAEEADVFDREQKTLVRKKVGKIGIMTPPGTWLWQRYDAVGAVSRGTELIVDQVTGIPKVLFSRYVGESVGGPIAIVSKVHEDSQEGPRQVLFTAALLSVSLCVFNLLPIPILDGGHLLLLFIEFIRRRKLSSREVYTAQMVGLSIIGVLFVLVTYNDIARIIFKR